MGRLKTYFSSSIGKKQIIAASGLALVIFILGHLAGNLLIFLGPDVFNAYAHGLHSLGPVLEVIEFSLLLVFVTHIYFTVKLILENRRARGSQYKSYNHSDRSFATRTMRYTGPLIFFFLLLHLSDFTLDLFPKNTILLGEDLGVYGMVVSALLNPVRAAIYILAVLSVGFHLGHGIRSVFQSFGCDTASKSRFVEAVSIGIGAFVGFGFASIPIYLHFLYSAKEIVCPN